MEFKPNLPFHNTYGSVTNMMSQREVDDYERNVLGLVRSSDLNNTNANGNHNINQSNPNTHQMHHSGTGVGYDNATGNVTTKMNDNPYLSKLKQMIYKNRDAKGQSQCHPIDSKDKTSNMNTGVSKNQKDSHNIT